MCGISGIFYYTDAGKTAEEALVKKMTGTLVHRGPDDEGFFFEKNFGMGVRRLSIIDRAGGHQPIHNEDKSIWAACNGEIYNFPQLRADLLEKGHTFYTRSDTEVLVHLYEEYGEGLVDRLSGMFAFALFDAKEKKAYVVRDRIGIKPLYYYDKNGLFIFGSELKAIIAHPQVAKTVDAASLGHFLSLDYVPAPHTIFKDIAQLPGGSCITVSGAGIQQRRYWDLSHRGYFDAAEETLAQRLEELLSASVRRHLISDVEVGAFLSGGLDSSSIAAIVARVLRKPLKTFCVAFDEALFDESAKARNVSAFLDTEHHEILCRPKDVIACVPKIALQADNLLADQAALPLYLVAGLAKSHVGVVLSGDGSDEIFAGYSTYAANRYRQYYRAMPKFLRAHVIAPCANAMAASTKKLGFDYTLKKFIEGAEFSREKAHYWWRTVFTEDERRGILAREIAALIKNNDSFDIYGTHFAKSDFPLFSSRCLYADLKVWLPDNNLTRLDAITMAHSLEARVPFLDHEVVEFASRLPFHLKLRGSQPKYILSRAMRKVLPRAVCRQKKSPWHAPLAGWFKTELRDYIRSSLLDSRSINRFFNRSSVEALIDDHLKGKQNNSFKMWGLLVFVHWHDTFEPNDIA